MLFNEDKKPETKPSTEYSEDMFGQIGTAFKELITTQKTGFSERVKEFENAIMGLSPAFGGGRAFAQTLRESFTEAAINVKRLGGDMADVINIQQAAAEGLGGVTILTSEAIEDLYSSIVMVEGGMDVTKESAKSLMENFTKAGFSVYNIGQEVTKVFNVAKEAGVNAKLVFDDIEKNIGKLNMFNFKNGVEGMAKMAAQSQMLRVSMQETLDFAENLYDPEKAVEVASVFQRLGLGSMTNVYQLQDIARSDPGKLQDMLANEFTRFVEIDAETGERKINAMGQEVIRVLTKEVPGLKTDFIVQSGLAMAEFQDKVKNINLPDWASDESLRSLIYEQAKLGEKGTEFQGQYIINFEGAAREISTLTKDEMLRFKETVEAQGQPNKDMAEALRSGQSETLQLKNEITALHNFYPNLLASNKNVVDAMNKASGALLTQVKNIGKSALFGIEYQEKPTKSERADISQRKSDIDEKVGGFTEGMQDAITKLITDISSGNKDATTAFKDFQTQMGEVFTDVLPDNFAVDIGKKITEILSNPFGSLGITNPLTSTPSQGTVQGAVVTTNVTNLTPNQTLTPSSSVVNLVQQTPFNLNLNVNMPNLDQRFQAFITDPIFMGHLTDELQKELQRRYPNARFPF